MVLRDHAEELAMIDSIDGGNPVREMCSDARWAARLLDFHAGLVTEIKGSSIPMGDDEVNFSVREPVGVVARIVAFNHPLMFCAGRMAAPLAAGNAVIIKPPEQAPLSGIRLAELVDHLLPPGALGILTGGMEVGATLSSHAGVDMVTLVGSVPTGRAVYQAGAATIKPVIRELGGKNALIACADADPDEVAAATIKGMALKDGTFIEPTVFADVTPQMRIAREEIFGPVQAVLRWSDEAEMLHIVNSVEYGLTAAVFSNDINQAHRIAAAVDVGYLWINTVGTHFLGAPFGSVKQSGIGHDECLSELLAFTREKNIHIKVRPYSA